MVGPGSDGEGGPASGGTGRGASRRARTWLPLVLAGVVVAVAAAGATGLLTKQDGSRVVASRPPNVASTPSSGPDAASASPDPTSPGPTGSAASSLLAVVDAGGNLATMDDHGGSVVSYAAPDVIFGFPAWSPDGSRIAAVGTGSADTAIYVFDVRRSGAASSAEPVVIYRSPGSPPFYLYWTPDGQRVAFLATESDGLSLRIAPADGSAPVDGSGPGSIIRRGAPLYFDWETADRLLLHVGSGSDAFVGEVGPNGAGIGPAVPGTGDFRSASASRDGRYLAWARSGTDPPGEIVVASRDGASHHELPVFGSAAFVFDPTGDTLAAIAADSADPATPSFPLGPLRLIDARSGAVRALLDGSVVAFFWAPDGQTIAGIRLPAGGQTARAEARLAPGLVAARLVAAPAAAATPPPGAEVRLTFVDVTSGAVRSERTVRLASHFVGALLPYFDQYALSHRLWAPDSSSIVLPLVDSTGGDQLVVIPSDGAAGRPVANGVSGFWSP